MKLAKLKDPVDQKIRKLHKTAQRNAVQAVKNALQCGELLLKKHERTDHGDWLPYLETVGISQPTAHRYMVCAHRRKLEGGADAKSLMDLYRAYGLLPELAGGGQRNGKPDRAAGGGQLFFDFNLFDGFMRVIEATKDNPFTTTDLDELEATRARTARALELMDEALSAQPTEKGKKK